MQKGGQGLISFVSFHGQGRWEHTESRGEGKSAGTAWGILYW